MALTEGMREQIAKDAGVKDAFAKGDKAAAKIIATMAELGITGGVIGAGGKLVYKGIKGARAMAEARKAIAAAKKLKQAGKNLKQQGEIAKKFKKTKPAASAKPKPETGKTTVMPKKSRSVTTTTRTSPKTTTQPKKPMKRVQGTDKPSAKKAVKSPPKASPKAPAKKGLTNAQKTGGAAALLAAAVTADRISRKSGETKAATLKTKEGGPGRKAGEGKTKPKASYQPANAGKRKGPQYQPANAGKKKQKNAGSTPDKAKNTASIKRTNISASKNTGFGPGGHLFPSSGADRKRLMRIWGGTGSKAAAAAKRGTQGTWLADSKKRKKK